MNREEIKHFKAMLRQGSLRHMNILLDDKFQKELLNIIKDYEKLQQENNQLKEQYCERTDCSGRLGNSRKVEKLIQENKELHNKIDKAIEYIEDYGHGYDCTGDGYYCLDEENQKELLKILKESDVNE